MLMQLRHLVALTVIFGQTEPSDKSMPVHLRVAGLVNHAEPVLARTRRQQVANRPCQSIELGDDELITLTDVIQACSSWSR
jgi:hypothetical protein